MKAYDKIYVNYSTGNFVPAIGEKLNGQDEYIRKDALLEWAKEVINDTSHSLAYRGAFRDLIEHIESL